jgi:hypothetical protein
MTLICINHYIINKIDSQNLQIPYQINNLDFLKINDYFSLYLNNNSKLQYIINKNINNYNKHYNFSDYFKKEDNLVTRLLCENYNLIFTLNAIINKKMTGYCLLTKKEYNCEKISYNKTGFLYEQIGYHFNCNGDEFIIFLSWEYFSPSMIVYPKQQITYNISYRYPNISFNSTIINPQNVDNKIKYCIGIISNAGHYFWNEVFGLMFLINNNLIDNIDEFVIGPFDYLDVGTIMKNKYNKSTKYINTTTNNNDLLVNTVKKYINMNLIDTFKKVYDVNKKIISNKIHIAFDIRTNRRVCNNSTENIIYIINKLSKKFKNIEFYISGWYTVDSNKSYELIADYKKSQQVFTNIQEEVNIPIHNLIGKPLKELVKIIDLFDIIVSNDGSGIGFYSKILTNAYNISYTNNYVRDGFQSQEIFFNKKMNHIYIDKKYITNISDDMETDFIIDSNILYNSILEKYLLLNNDKNHFEKYLIL